MDSRVSSKYTPGQSEPRFHLLGKVVGNQVQNPAINILQLYITYFWANSSIEHQSLVIRQADIYAC